LQCIREVELKSLQGRKLAIDASMQIYQFMIAVRSGGPNQSATMLTNADGETTSHIQGMFNRTIRFLTEGIKPAYIFDGKPPQFKSGELLKRRQKREKAQAELEKATEEGNVEEQDKQSKRLVRAGHKENQDCQRLLKLMGVPVIVAPCEAEAQASALCKEGVFYATATEDMDALTFQTPVLVRKMAFANQSKSMVQSLNYQKAVDGLGLTHEQFVDLCILMGCDYTDTIKGVGPKTALKLIKEHGSIEGILKTIDRTKYHVPKEWIPEDQGEEDTDKEDDENAENNQDPKPEPAFVQARRLFHNHEVLKGSELGDALKWKEPQVEELTKFLVEENGFNPERVAASISKLQLAFKANQKPQSRMDSFFQVKANPLAAAKRKQKVEEQKSSAKGNKKAKTAGGRKKR
jgi:flap endonuclease-1